MIQQFYDRIADILEFILLHMLNRDYLWEEFLASSRAFLGRTWLRGSLAAVVVAVAYLTWRRVEAKREKVWTLTKGSILFAICVFLPHVGVLALRAIPWIVKYTEQFYGWSAVPAVATLFAAYRLRYEKSEYIRRRIYISIASWWILWEGMSHILGKSNPIILEIGGNQYTQTGIYTAWHFWSLFWFVVLTLLVFFFGRRIFCAHLCYGSLLWLAAGPLLRHRNPTGRIARALGYLVYPIVGFWMLFLFSAIMSGLRVGPFDMDIDGDRLFLDFMDLFGKTFVTIVVLMPILGVRTCDRFFCPMGTWYGLVSRLGRFRIDWNPTTCVRCGLCNKVCDSSLPVLETVMKKGRMKSIRCNGCGECVSNCPTGSLTIRCGFGKKRPPQPTAASAAKSE